MFNFQISAGVAIQLLVQMSRYSCNSTIKQIIEEHFDPFLSIYYTGPFLTCRFSKMRDVQHKKLLALISKKCPIELHCI